MSFVKKVNCPGSRGGWIHRKDVMSVELSPTELPHGERPTRAAGVMFSLAPVPYFNECKPIMVPSGSKTRAMKPYSPIAIFSRITRPPCAAARAASTAQSAQLK